jgi:hypothetical protein
MTALSDKFKQAAQKVVAKFSVGDYSYQDISGETYNADTGTVTRVPITTLVPAARYEVDEDKRASLSYSEDTCIVAMAGLDLGAVVPKVGALVVFPDTTRHRIVYIERDQYDACYFLHVTETPIGS